MPQSQMTMAYQNLRDLILGLDLTPGERLSERWLEARFGGSRTPVRAALLRLETEGLVEREGRGYIVAPIDLKDIEQACVFRETVEAGAVRLACERATPEEIDAIESMLDTCGPETPREEWLRIGDEFHLALARLSGNAFFTRAIEDLMTRIARARWLEAWSDQGRSRAWAEHRQILALVRERKADDAARALAFHTRVVRDHLLDSLRQERRGLRARGFAVVSR